MGKAQWSTATSDSGHALVDTSMHEDMKFQSWLTSKVISFQMDYLILCYSSSFTCFQ